MSEAAAKFIEWEQVSFLVSYLEPANLIRAGVAYKKDRPIPKDVVLARHLRFHFRRWCVKGLGFEEVELFSDEFNNQLRLYWPDM